MHQKMSLNQKLISNLGLIKGNNNLYFYKSIKSAIWVKIRTLFCGAALHQPTALRQCRQQGTYVVGNATTRVTRVTFRGQNKTAVKAYRESKVCFFFIFNRGLQCGFDLVDVSQLSKLCFNVAKISQDVFCLLQLSHKHQIIQN